MLEPHEVLPRDLFDAIPPPEPLPNLFLARAEASKDRIVSYSKVQGRWVGLTWRESRQAVEEIALGLLELGLEKRDAVAILSQTRREWSQVDMAIICAGGVTAGIYPTLTGPQVRQLLDLSRARIAFVDERAQRVKLVEAARGLDPPLLIVTFEATAEEDGAITLDELRRRGAKRRKAMPEELGRRLREIKTDDVVSYIYTSGTTGEPKGAMLTHASFHYTIHATSALIPYQGKRSLIFLPLAHSLQRYASYLGLVVDAEGYYAESFDKVRDNLLEVRPSAFALVPRVLEKIHARAIAAGEEGTPLQRRLFGRSLEVLRDVGRVRRRGDVPGLRQRLYARAADGLVGSRVRDRLGGRVEFIGSGGAPLASEVHEFFEDIGIPILEGYGLTETCAPACINTLDSRRIGSVGRPLPGTAVKIAADGEILIKGPGVFAGYFGSESATRDAFDEDGWFKTGDIGVMSRDGFLSITDRKKDLIITSGGKNIAPQPIENELKRHPLIGQAIVIGDRRPYLTALLALEPDARAQLADRHGVDAGALGEVPEVRREIERHLAGVNRARPSFEQIKRFEIIPGELTLEAGELTPTLKVKRRVVAEHHGDRIDRLYREGK